MPVLIALLRDANLNSTTATRMASAPANVWAMVLRV